MRAFVPQLWISLRNYTVESLIQDSMAGLLVAIIAFPLSIALALASGVGPEEGLYTAIVAGFLIAALGGSRVQVSGPTAAFATIVAGIVARHGMDGLMTATIMAGLMLLVMGFLRMGTLIKYIPYTITIGFTAGIAVTIIVGQCKDFLGLDFYGARPIDTVAKFQAAMSHLDTINLAALSVGCLSLAILIFGRRISRKIPSSLIAVLVTGGLVYVADLPVLTIGDLYTISGALPTWHWPVWSYTSLVALLPDAFTIALLAAIESLLSAVVADELTGGRHNSNMELVAQGVGNMGAAFLGGIPATGAIARTAANITNGAVSPLASMIHALFLVAIMLILMPYAALIPMPCIAAILLQVAYNMSGLPLVRAIIQKAPKSDIAVLVITFLLTVFFDLVIAITIGLILACLLFMKRMADVADVKEWKYVEDTVLGMGPRRLKQVPDHVMVYEFMGPLFFGAADKIPHIGERPHKSVLIVRMRGVPAMDVTALKGLRRLRRECVQHGIHVVFSHVNEQPMQVFKKSGFYDEVGAENIQPHIDAALERAKALGPRIKA